MNFNLTAAAASLPAHLCLGFMTWRQGDCVRETLETHWAVVDGVVFATEVRAPTIHFGGHQDGTKGEWRIAAALPDNAEFIGNYPRGLVGLPERFAA